MTQNFHKMTKKSHHNYTTIKIPIPKTQNIGANKYFCVKQLHQKHNPKSKPTILTKAMASGFTTGRHLFSIILF